MDNILSVISQIAESKISEAIKEGKLDNLPGMGKPLKFEDDSNVPEELRMAYKILKNSGCLPPEMAKRKEACNLIEYLENCPDEQETIIKIRKLNLLAKGMENFFRDHPQLEEHDEYYQKILAKIRLFKNRKNHQ